MSQLRSYTVVTGAYWGFTLSDGALRMLVLLYFHGLGYSPFELASLFLFYEFFGIVTNLVGGWIGARLGLKVTLFGGLALQVVALLSLSALTPDWSKPFAVAYVMGCQALSGIAKDLTKMSSKSAVKLVVPADAGGTLYRWVALLTGSKNALKGIGFFLGGLLLDAFGFDGALQGMAVVLAAILLIAIMGLPGDMGRAKAKPKFAHIFSKTRSVNVLSAARFFLFGARDVWFVVALPVFLAEVLHWSHTQIGGFLALWVIGYGVVQSLAPGMTNRSNRVNGPTGGTARGLAFVLAAVPAAIAMSLDAGWDAQIVVVAGLLLFGVVFAVNSAVHSYLILKYSDHDKVAMNVGFYYMANAGGRLVGTVLSGAVYQGWGLAGCLWVSVLFVLTAAVLSMALPSDV